MFCYTHIFRVLRCSIKKGKPKAPRLSEIARYYRMKEINDNESIASFKEPSNNFRQINPDPTDQVLTSDCKDNESDTTQEEIRSIDTTDDSKDNEFIESNTSNRSGESNRELDYNTKQLNSQKVRHKSQLLSETCVKEKDNESIESNTSNRELDHNTKQLNSQKVRNKSQPLPEAHVENDTETKQWVRLNDGGVQEPNTTAGEMGYVTIKQSQSLSLALKL